jgi:hypothetical protein
MNCTACSALDILFSYSIIMIRLNVFILQSIGPMFSRFEMAYNSLMAEESLQHLHRRVCTGVCAFFVVGVAFTKQVS